MVRWAEGISREAIVLVEGRVKMPPENQGEIKSTTVHQRELQIEKVHWFNRFRKAVLTAIADPRGGSSNGTLAVPGRGR
jgi:hypothetical protein